MSIESVLVPIRLALFLAGCGAFFALGFASVCKWLEWSPVNVTVNINNPPSQVGTNSTDTERTP